MVGGKIYSVAKLFTALEIFREVEERLIELDNPFLDYLPDFAIQSRNNEDPGMKNSAYSTVDLSDPKLIAKGYEFYYQFDT